MIGFQNNCIAYVLGYMPVNALTGDVVPVTDVVLLLQSLRDIPVWKQLHNLITRGYVYSTT